eukprot:g17913.t1
MSSITKKYSVQQTTLALRFQSAPGPGSKLPQQHSKLWEATAGGRKVVMPTPGGCCMRMQHQAGKLPCHSRRPLQEEATTGH